MAEELFAQLVELADRYRRSARPLPAREEVAETRTVVCFRVLGALVGVLLEELDEVLEVPHCTRLPRVRSWVRGVANVRGKLMPVIDFASFLGGRLTAPPKRQRLLVVERRGIAAGLVVDEVLGMRHFRVDGYGEERAGVPPPLSPYVPGTFVLDGQRVPLFRPDALFASEEFLRVAA
ncbi:MAG: protein PilI [Porticoccaceae bacterium]|nr:MAG: protein PilI [Porticoccaceae bacterium]